ncbi:hypothetical protein [Yinghuangia seranimata]|uniref:hypothetical protein n=1 Tax=Yinghuangia seranimata TaxID=408067 RepID=UPI00248CA336|nr:hypothetical protein [Yinghuangia seranimata]MDI2132699.1 hypothetical protein [Yinghuangia seranimata]
MSGTSAPGAPAGGVRGVLRRWWFEPVAGSRIAWVRALVYLFIPFDILVVTQDVKGTAALPGNLYQPVLFARLLHLPTPTPGIADTLQWVLLIAAPLAATGRFHRVLGVVVAAAFSWWQLINMSYGKVDHDHFAIMMAVWLLPTAGRARFRDDTPSEAAGWTLRCMQIAAISTYSLAAWAKVKESGWGWASGATFTWAIERRGTPLGHWFLNHPDLLRFGQWVVFVAEVLSPVILFLRRWWLAAALVFWLGFHLFTWLCIGIHFLPTIITLTAFVPWERARATVEGRFAGRRAARPARTESIPAEQPA